MRDNLGLQVLVGYPVDIRREEVQFDGNAPLGGLKLSNHDGHAFVYAGVRVEIFVNTTHIEVEVCECSTLEALGFNLVKNG